MAPDSTFHTAYRDLERRMKLLADSDGDTYLPNPEPAGPADYVFICMEPSLGRWARSPAEAKSKVQAGFRNFLSSFEDFLLHFCIQKYLCQSGQTYYMTDLSKGAMLVQRAGTARTERYDRWYGLLLEELDLVAKPNARVFAVGNAVAKQLRRRAFPRPVHALIHYSGLAAKARSHSIAGKEEQFAEFIKSLSLQQVLEVAGNALSASTIPSEVQNATLARIAGSQFSVSRKQLVFSYRLSFEKV